MLPPCVDLPLLRTFAPSCAPSTADGDRLLAALDLVLAGAFVVHLGTNFLAGLFAVFTTADFSSLAFNSPFLIETLPPRGGCVPECASQQPSAGLLNPCLYFNIKVLSKRRFHDHYSQGLERGHFDFGWLDTFHTFHSANTTTTTTWVSRPARDQRRPRRRRRGLPHPSAPRMEIITYVLEARSSTRIRSAPARSSVPAMASA